MTEAALLNHLKENPFVLAPMAGITDSPFRSFMREMGAGVVVTELVSATGLYFKSDKTRDLMRFEDEQRPIGIQIFGEEIDHLAHAAKVIEESGADFVDLNFGCPVPKVVKKGAGSAVLKDLKVLKEVLRAVKSASNLPVTIKIRTGWDESSKNSHEVCQVAYDEGITWVAIHGRTRAAAYTGRADWTYISEVKEKAKMPVLGNGDSVTAEMALSRLNETKCDGVLIGRGCLKNPWIFRDGLSLFQGSSEVGERNLEWVFNKLRSYLDKMCNERIALLQIKKFSSWYSSGFPGSAQFRRDLFQQKEADKILLIVQSYFESLRGHTASDTSHEPFLMGGHG